MSQRVILFPTDFSSVADEGLRHAASFARQHGSRLLVLHVVEPPAAYAGEMYYGLPEPDEGDLRLMLERVRPDDTSIPVEHRLVHGQPAAEIARLADEVDAEMIVMTTHGRTGLRRLLMGSVAEQVMRHANCPVLTLRAHQTQMAGKE